MESKIQIVERKYTFLNNPVYQGASLNLFKKINQRC